MPRSSREIRALVLVCAAWGLVACGSAANVQPTTVGSHTQTPTQTTSQFLPTPTPTPVPHGTAAVDLRAGAAVVKIGMTGDNTDPNGAHFVPDLVTVRVGQIVEWDFDPLGFPGHNIVFDGDESLSNRKGLGSKPDGSPGDGTWQVRFSQPGSYHYVCTYHLPTMTGRVNVTA